MRDGYVDEFRVLYANQHYRGRYFSHYIIKSIYLEGLMDLERFGKFSAVQFFDLLLNLLLLKTLLEYRIVVRFVSTNIGGNRTLCRCQLDPL